MRLYCTRCNEPIQQVSTTIYTNYFDVVVNANGDIDYEHESETYEDGDGGVIPGQGPTMFQCGCGRYQEEEAISQLIAEGKATMKEDE